MTTITQRALELFRAGRSPAQIGRLLLRSTQRISEILSRARRRGAPGLERRPPIPAAAHRPHHCGRCGQYGHNARTCERTPNRVTHAIEHAFVRADSTVVLFCFALSFLGFGART